MKRIRYSDVAYVESILTILYLEILAIAGYLIVNKAYNYIGFEGWLMIGISLLNFFIMVKIILFLKKTMEIILVDKEEKQ